MSRSTPSRPSAAVYRRRRLVALIAVVAVVVAIVLGVWLAVAQPWSGTDAATPRATPKPSPSATVTGTPTPDPTESTPVEGGDPTPEATGTARPCAAADVTVEALTDADTYSAGQNPLLSIRLTNTSAKDCTINVGTTSQSFTISSGNDVWWRSTDCQTEPSDMIVTLAAGQEVTSATPLAWDRTRSSVGSCGDADRPRASGGGASYHLTVEIGGIPSQGSKQFLLY